MIAMRTALDSSVLILLYRKQAGWERWRDLLRAASLEGTLIVSPVAFAEYSVAYATLESARADLARIVQLWTALLGAHGGPFLFGKYCIADAYFAPVVKRIVGYALPVPPVVAAYVAQVEASAAVIAWTKDAVAERDFIPFDEPYRKSGTAPAAR